jgi:hypothetical protein
VIFSYQHPDVIADLESMKAKYKVLRGRLISDLVTGKSSTHLPHLALDSFTEQLGDNFLMEGEIKIE